MKLVAAASALPHWHSELEKYDDKIRDLAERDPQRYLLLMKHLASEKGEIATRWKAIGNAVYDHISPELLARLRRLLAPDRAHRANDCLDGWFSLTASAKYPQFLEPLLHRARLDQAGRETFYRVIANPAWENYPALRAFLSSLQAHAEPDDQILKRFTVDGINDNLLLDIILPALKNRNQYMESEVVIGRLSQRGLVDGRLVKELKKNAPSTQNIDSLASIARGGRADAEINRLLTLYGWASALRSSGYSGPLTAEGMRNGAPSLQREIQIRKMSSQLDDYEWDPNTLQGYMLMGEDPVGALKDMIAFAGKNHAVSNRAAVMALKYVRTREQFLSLPLPDLAHRSEELSRRLIRTLRYHPDYGGHPDLQIPMPRPVPKLFRCVDSFMAIFR